MPTRSGLRQAASSTLLPATVRSCTSQVTPLIKLFDAYQGYFTAVNSSIKDMANVRDRLKSDPSSVSFAFPVGLGTPLHVSVVNVGRGRGPAAKLVTVVFNSGSDVAAQVAGHHVDVGLTSIGSPYPMIQAG